MAVKNKFLRIFRLLAISAKMDLVWLLRDTKYAIAGITADIAGNLAVVSSVFLIAARFGGIGGMSSDEVLFMMAYSTLVTGIFTMFGSGNNIHISRIIGRGQLEHLFIQPLSIGTQLDLGGLLKTFARELSLGQRMRADLGMLLLHSPELILLDEPTLGLDVIAKRQMIEFLKRINRENAVTIIVTSHDMDDLEEMARRILMISDGRIAYDGSFAGLRSITGNLTRIAVTMENESVPVLNHACLLSSENQVNEYEIDLTSIPVKELIRQLSSYDGIKDVEIRKAPIEQIIARLYKSWV